MTARTAQRLIAATFLILGGWCLLAPASIIDLAFQPAFRSGTYLDRFLIACFGAQACLAGLFAATARFSRTTFAAYGAALLPFFVFDWYFYAVVPLLTPLGLLDAVGNLAMLLLCVVGWRDSPAERP